MLLLLQSWKVAFREKSVRVPWRNLFGKRGRTTQRLDFFDFLAAFIGARLFA